MNTILSLPKKSGLLAGLVCTFLMVSPAFSQQQPIPNSALHGLSAGIGGLSDFKAGAFLYGELGYGLGQHLSLVVTFHRDDTHETWSDGSKGYYRLYSPLVGLRWSRFPNGRGFFVQTGIGQSSAKLRVTEANGTIKTDEANTPFANGKLGYRWSPRWGRKPTGFFAEAVLNYSVSWQDAVLQTDPAPAGTPDRRPSIDYHSWNNYKGTVGQSFLIGIGYTF